MRILRIYHAGRDPGHRARERALHRAGADLTLVVPRQWQDAGAEERLSPEPFRIIEVDVNRSGDVNRHTYRNDHDLVSAIRQVEPDLVDLHEEPFSLAARQWLRLVGDIPVVMYSAQNLDKRFPPPFARFETRALTRAAGLYPCTRQAASVARGKGFAGLVRVLPLGYDTAAYSPGVQSLDDDVLVLGLVGRLVPEKGVQDAVRVIAAVQAVRAARLEIVGSGPELEPALHLAAELGVRDAVHVAPWQSASGMAETYRRMHVVLVPSRATETWVEQFGRVIVEGQASGAVVAGYASGSIPEVAGQAGILVPEGDSNGLARQVVALLEDPAGYERRQQDGLRATRSLGWDEVARHQVAFYKEVLSADSRRLTLPRTAAGRRAAARAEFGEPARTPAGERPFALPYLRRDSIVSRTMAAAIDTAVTARERLPLCRAR